MSYRRNSNSDVIILKWYARSFLPFFISTRSFDRLLGKKANELNSVISFIFFIKRFQHRSCEFILFYLEIDRAKEESVIHRFDAK